jgi:hypothetical protein
MAPPTCRDGSGLSSPRDALHGYRFGPAAVASRPRPAFVPGGQIEVVCDLKCRVGIREAWRCVTVGTVSVTIVIVRRSIGAGSNTMSTTHSPPLSLAWAEIGRAAPGGGAPWVVCIAPIGESGALYRTQIVADSVLTITVDFIAHRGAPVRRVHRASCKISPDVDILGEPVKRLVKAADEAARIVLTGSSRDRPQTCISVGAIDDEAVQPLPTLPTARQQATAAASQFDQPIHGL